MPSTGKKPKAVIFVCAGNTCRSPMAAALAGQLLGKDTRVESAGTAAETGAGATQEAIQVMSERGLNLRGHRSRPVGRVKLADFDVVVALTPMIGRTLRENGLDASKLRVLSIPDPIGGGVDTYRETAVAIETYLRRLFCPDDARQNGTTDV